MPIFRQPSHACLSVVLKNAIIVKDMILASVLATFEGQSLVILDFMLNTLMTSRVGQITRPDLIRKIWVRIGCGWRLQLDWVGCWPTSIRPDSKIRTNQSTHKHKFLMRFELYSDQITSFDWVRITFFPTQLTRNPIGLIWT